MKKISWKLVVSAFTVLSIAALASCGTRSISSSNQEESTISASENITCKITFIVNSEETVVEVHSDGIEPPVKELENKRFAGWSLNKDSSDILFLPTDTITIDKIKEYLQDRSLTLYAVYADLCTVTFHNSKLEVVVLDSLLGNMADVKGDHRDGYEFIGWTTKEGSMDVVFGVDDQIDYGAIAKQFSNLINLDLYPVYASLSSNIKPTSYFAPDVLPEIHIATENGIAIDDKSLIDPTQKKGSNGEIPVYNYVNASINVNKGEEGSDLSNVTGQVKVRGNYTSTYAKKPIRIKFEKKQSLLGLNKGNKCKSWVLLAEWKDSSLLRNSLAGYLGNSILESDGYYCSDFRFVKVYLNGSYNGVYALAEQQQVNQYRVNIPESELSTDGVDTGYLLEFDGYYKNEPAIQTFTVDYSGVKTLTNGFTVVNDIMNSQQHDFIAKVTQTVFSVVYDATRRTHANIETAPYHTMDENGDYIEDRTIKTAEEAVSKVVDITSLVDMYILHEILQDRDIGWSSFYLSIDMSKNGNKKLTFEAPWDFDYAIGNNTYSNAMKASLADRNKMISDGRLVANGRSYLFKDSTSLSNSDFTFTNKEALYAKSNDNPWLSVCNTQGWFWHRVENKWNEAYSAGVFTKASEMLNELSLKYIDDFAENFKKWSGSISKKIDMYQPDLVQYFVNQRQAGEYLKVWFDNRIEGLNVALPREASKYTN